MNPPDFGKFQNQLRLFENSEELILFNIKTPIKKQKTWYSIWQRCSVLTFDFHVEFRVLNKKAAQKSGFFIDLGHLTFISQLLQTIDITAIILILI